MTPTIGLREYSSRQASGTTALLNPGALENTLARLTREAAATA